MLAHNNNRKLGYHLKKKKPTILKFSMTRTVQLNKASMPNQHENKKNLGQSRTTSVTKLSCKMLVGSGEMAQ